MSTITSNAASNTATTLAARPHHRPRRQPAKRRGAALATIGLLATACGTDGGPSERAATDEAPTTTEAESTTTVESTTVVETEPACAAQPEVLVTNDGVEYLRTPDVCFENLPDWDYEPRYVEIDGLRQAYIDEGPEDGNTILLLHGQPSWSYLYRDMIPHLVDDGYRVIAMDHLGMERSDKPIHAEEYSVETHVRRLETFVDEVGITGADLFAQDWGSILGLYALGGDDTLFDRVAIGNGGLPIVEQAIAGLVHDFLSNNP